MRPDERRAQILKEIERVWDRFPDLRLFQLLMNALPRTDNLYYFEDDELLTQLRESPAYKESA